MTEERAVNMCYWLYTTANARKMSRENGIPFEKALEVIKANVPVENLVVDLNKEFITEGRA